MCLGVGWYCWFAEFGDLVILLIVLVLVLVRILPWPLCFGYYCCGLVVCWCWW